MKLQGKEKLLRRLRAIPKEARKEIHKALDKSAAEMADLVRSFAPIDSGDLRRSIGYTFGEYKPENANVRGMSGGGGLGDPDLTVTIHAGDAKAYYAAMVEFGTKPHAQPDNPYVGYRHPGSSPTPFFFPAYRIIKKRMRSRISRATSKAAKKAANG